MTIGTTTTATGATAAAAAPSSAATAAQNQLGVDYNNFLTLLTAQIQNQDPLQPMDSTQFVSQLAQLSQVEQAVQSNANLEKLNTQLSSVSGIVSLGLVGRQVQVASDKLQLAAGAAQTTYRLSATAASASATITDAAGTVVRTLTGLATTAGTELPLAWDGRNDAGQALADGTYHVAIKALDTAGNTVSYDTYPTTTVEKVNFSAGGDTLLLGNGDEVPASQLVSVN